MDEEVDDRYAGIDIDSLLNRSNRGRPFSYGRKKTLYEAPEFIMRLNGEETIMEGQSLCLECKVRGFPAPTLRWFKDDEQILDHPRIRVESDGQGTYFLMIDNVQRGDEAAYRCRAENLEGSCSSYFFLSVKGKPKSQRKKDGKGGGTRRTVSFPPMFSTIVEKVEEEDKQAEEMAKLPPSPLTDFYYAMTLKSRASWPAFLGDWAFAKPRKRRTSDRSDDSDDDAENLPNGDHAGARSPAQGRDAARRSLKRSDLAARAEAKKQRVAEEKKKREEEEEEKRLKEEEEEAKKRREEQSAMILEKEKRRKEEMKIEEEHRKREEAMKKRRQDRAERMEREIKEQEEKERLEKEKKEEEKRQKEAEERRRHEEEKRRREEERKKEEERRIEEQKKLKEQRKIEEARKLEEEKKKAEEEKRRLDQKKKEEEDKRRLEQKKKEEEEDKRRLEQKKKEEEEKRRLEQKKKVEEEKKRLEQKKKEEEEKRLSEKKKKAEEDERKKKLIEEEKKKKEATDKLLLEKKRKEEDERLRKEKETLKRKEDLQNRESEEAAGKKAKLKTVQEQQKKDALTDNTTTFPQKKAPKALQMFQEKSAEPIFPKGYKVAAKTSGDVEASLAKPQDRDLKQSPSRQPPAVLPKAAKPQDIPAANLKDSAGITDSTTDSSSSQLKQQKELLSKFLPSKAALLPTSPETKRNVEAGKQEDLKPNIKSYIGKVETPRDREKKAGEDLNQKPKPKFLIEKEAREAARKKQEEELKMKQQKDAAEAKIRQEEREAKLRKQKEEEAKLKKLKEDEAKLKKQKEEEIKLKKQKEEEAKSKKQKEEETKLKKQKEEEAKLKKQREEKDSLLKKQKELEEKKSKEEGKQKKMIEEEKKNKLLEEELRRKQEKQKEELRQQQLQEEKRKREEKEKEEKEELRRQYKKEQIRKEQLRRQQEEETRRRQEKKKKEEEERRRREETKDGDEAKRIPQDNDEDGQVKVYKRDYSFHDLRKSLEAHVGNDVMDAAEHKYWDEILEKHDYSISDIRKAFDTTKASSNERPSRMRSRRNSMEELDIIKLKRSSSISDLRDSFTMSLGRPKKKHTEKRQKDEEFLKRATPLTSLRQKIDEEIQKQHEPAVTTKKDALEADITINRLKPPTGVGDRSRERSLSPYYSSKKDSISPDPSSTCSSVSEEATKVVRRQNQPEFAKPAANVAAKRASFHEMVSQKLEKERVTVETARKRMSYTGHDAYGSKEIPTYRRAAGWSDDVEKLRSVRNPDAPVPSKATVEKAGSKNSHDVQKSDDDVKVRPFVYNSMRTIARKFRKE